MDDEMLDPVETAQGDAKADDTVESTDKRDITEPGWLESLPPELRNDELLKGVKDMPDLVGKYRDALSKAHEAPATPADYEFKVPDGYQVNPDFISAMTHIAHESGISKTQMKSMAEKFMALESLVLQQRTKDDQAAWDALRLNLTDRFDESVSLAEKAARAFAGDAFAKEIREKKVHPRAIEVWSKIGRAISDDMMIDGEARAGKTSIRRMRDGQPVLEFK